MTIDSSSIISNKTKIHPIFLIVAAGLIGFFFEI